MLLHQSTSRPVYDISWPLPTRMLPRQPAPTCPKVSLLFVLGAHDLERDLLLLRQVNAAIHHGRPAPINLLQDPGERANERQ